MQNIKIRNVFTRVQTEWTNFEIEIYCFTCSSPIVKSAMLERNTKIVDKRKSFEITEIAKNFFFMMCGFWLFCCFVFSIVYFVLTVLNSCITYWVPVKKCIKTYQINQFSSCRLVDLFVQSLLRVLHVPQFWCIPWQSRIVYFIQSSPTIWFLRHK